MGWTRRKDAADDRLPKRAAELREPGRRRRGRPRLRWDDCVKREDEEGRRVRQTGRRRQEKEQRVEKTGQMYKEQVITDNSGI